MAELMDKAAASVDVAHGQNRPLLSVEDLRVEFPTASGTPRMALRGVDLQVGAGEILGLVGESGAGKTTLARSILGLPPVPGRISGGRVIFEGKDILALPERELHKLRGRRISMVVPNPRGELNPVLTVGDQIANVAKAHLGVSRSEGRRLALEMLRAVQIPDPERRMGAYPHELSGGMAQRAVIAIALICNPAFVISDDATSGLDVTVQAQVLELLQKLAAEHGSSLLFITRDVGITAHFCDRVAVLYAGEIMEIAPREELFLRPSHPYTLMLLAAFSHNPKLRKVWTVPDDRKRGVPRSGCPYADRCPLAQPCCVENAPPLVELTPGHLARCYFPVRHS
ncbi:ABC transporter ATP-binding protein [Microvirga sp. G4-2]|uniref:ABC transporter ATP-binding protein n=1 Tax=Microvirga sp. G4-2 TaxID=3434467 RepID=UPI004043E29B